MVSEVVRPEQTRTNTPEPAKSCLIECVVAACIFALPFQARLKPAGGNIDEALERSNFETELSPK